MTRSPVTATATNTGHLSTFFSPVNHQNSGAPWPTGGPNTPRFGEHKQAIGNLSLAAHEFEFVPIRRKGERSPAK